MRLTFILPSYPYRPMGGFRVVYQYANWLVNHGHLVTIVHAFTLDDPPNAQFPVALREAWRKILGTRRQTFPPKILWQPIDARVRMKYLPFGLDDRAVPDADYIFATSWRTVAFVESLPGKNGEKCYLIQGWEVWGDEATAEKVTHTWRLPFHKVVVSKWLEEKGVELGASDVAYIPNAIDHNVFTVLNPPEMRRQSIVTVGSSVPLKGTKDAIDVLTSVHRVYPDIAVTMFGAHALSTKIPEWIDYVENPTQKNLAEQIYNRSTIFLGAGWDEGWSLPPAEAMACGCVFVGTDTGGNRDFAVDGFTAFVCPPHDTASLYRNLVRAIEEPRLLRRIQRAGTEYIQRFTWDRSAMQLERWLKALTAHLEEGGTSNDAEGDR